MGLAAAGALGWTLAKVVVNDYEPSRYENGTIILQMDVPVFYLKYCDDCSN
jgi:hypothetical protein